MGKETKLDLLQIFRYFTGMAMFYFAVTFITFPDPINLFINPLAWKEITRPLSSNRVSERNCGANL